jgi:hypothetical protein
MEKPSPQNEQELGLFLQRLRAELERGFAPDTAAPGFEGKAPSAGQCAAVAAIINQLLGGKLVSVNVCGHSHWFNQISLGNATVEIDLTGDQFGRSPLQMGAPCTLYPDSRIRTFQDLRAETLLRAAILAARAGLTDVETDLRGSVQRKLDEEVSA